MKKKINHQKDVICFKKNMQQMSNCDCQENIEDEAATATENPIGDGLLSITTVATAIVGIFFRLRAMGIGQHDALLTSTSLVWLLSLPVWER